MRANYPKGMGGAGNMSAMLQQAQKMQEDMAALQEELDNLRRDAQIMRTVLDRAVSEKEKSAYTRKPAPKKAVRASMGTLFSQAIDRTDDLPAVIAELRASGRRVFAKWGVFMKYRDSLRGRLGSFVMVLLGNVIYALSVKLFLLPANLISCGTTGIALVVNHLTGMPMSWFIFAFNMAMLM